jgi:hypothetical protein
MPNVTIRLDPWLKAGRRLSGDLAEILSQASGPAESPRPAERVHAEAQRRSGPMVPSTQPLCSVNRTFVASVGTQNDKMMPFAGLAVGGHNPGQVTNDPDDQRQTVPRSRPKIDAAKRPTGTESSKQKTKSHAAKPAKTKLDTAKPETKSCTGWNTGGGNRTHTRVPPEDFKYAWSATCVTLATR